MSESLSGYSLECFRSQEFHSQGIPLLVSPELLRLRGLGQIDLSRLQKKKEWVIELAEVKSSSVGEDAFQRGQSKRIALAGKFLSGILGAPAKFIRLVG